MLVNIDYCLLCKKKLNLPLPLAPSVLSFTHPSEGGWTCGISVESCPWKFLTHVGPVEGVYENSHQGANLVMDMLLINWLMLIDLVICSVNWRLSYLSTWNSLAKIIKTIDHLLHYLFFSLATLRSIVDLVTFFFD